MYDPVATGVGEPAPAGQNTFAPPHSFSVEVTAPARQKCPAVHWPSQVLSLANTPGSPEPKCPAAHFSHVMPLSEKKPGAHCAQNPSSVMCSPGSHAEAQNLRRKEGRAAAVRRSEIRVEPKNGASEAQPQTCNPISKRTSGWTHGAPWEAHLLDLRPHVAPRRRRSDVNVQRCNVAPRLAVAEVFFVPSRRAARERNPVIDQIGGPFVRCLKPA